MNIRKILVFALHIFLLTQNYSYGQTSKIINGRVLEKNTKIGVSYAHIIVSGSSLGTVANDAGFFQINIPEEHTNSFLVFSSVGYGRDSIRASDFNQINGIIFLSPRTITLSEVEVTGKKLDAMEILKEASKRVKVNYYQEQFNQELFYRTQVRRNDTITFNEEASIITFDKSGYQARAKAYNSIFGEILQLRNTTNNRSNDEWFGAGSIWKVFTHDIILDNNNILHKSNAYTVEVSNITEFEGQSVYEISFICKNPSAVTTGFGFPDPEAATGKIYITEDDFAVVKFEICIKRKPYDYKQSKLRSVDWTVLLVQSYKKYKGKYFLHHSKQIHSQNLLNVETGKKDRVIEIFDLLSASVNIDNVVPIKVPIDRVVKGSTVKEDKFFWKNHNIAIEDLGITSCN